MLLLPHPAQNRVAASNIISSRKRLARLRPRHVPARHKPNSPKAGVSASQANPVPGAALGMASCAVVPVVLTLTVTEAALAPGVTEVGLMVQVENAGFPAQARLIALEKLPPPGLSPAGKSRWRRL